MEEAEGLESGSTGADAAGASGVDPAAVALALGGASREKADAFLDEQRALAANQSALIAEQRHHLREQFEQLAEQLKQLRLGTWEKRLGVFLRIATAFMGSLVAAGLAFMIWDASQSNRLLIEPFSVPSDLAARGMTGEVAAAKLLDRMKAIEGQVISLRAPRSYANSWSREDIKIDIPETGVSLLELDRLLREKLGHDTSLSGEIIHSDTGLVLSARTGAESTEDISGTASEMDSLIQRLAEAVYRVTQPYRYATYLARQGKIAESDAIMKKIVEGGESKDRPWAGLRLAASLRETTGLDKTLAALRTVVASDPDNSPAVLNIAEAQVYLSHPEAAIAGYKQDLLLLRGPNVMEMLPAAIPGELVMAQANIDAQLGAFRDAAQAFSQSQSFPVTGRFETAPQLARMFAGDHDVGGALEAMGLKFRDVPGYDGTRLGSFVWSRMEIAAEKSDWAGVLREAREVDSLLPQYPGLRSSVRTVMVPLVAFADAMLGDYGSAEAAISRTPADCYRCLIVRAQIAAIHGLDSRADWWFDRAVKAAPSIPFAYANWGQALLARGKPDDAIAQFKLANRHGPHFADPLEGWGEALMAKNQSHLALAKFMEADEYAPNWGRLHLKWGEALVYAGKRDEARAQFARAAALDLTLPEKSELARANHV